MAENINKLYRTGVWGQDNDQQRFDHVCYWITQFQLGYIDKMDLRWFIKNAFTRRVYISAEVKKLGTSAWLHTKNPFFLQLYNELQNKGYTDNQNALELRKWKGKGLVFEHVVPAEVFIPQILSMKENGTWNFCTFCQMRNKLHVCVITREEDKLLNTNKMKIAVPNPTNWLNRTDGEWDRYSIAGIQKASPSSNSSYIS